MRDNVLSTMTRYGLDGPGFEFWQGSDFLHWSRSALAPNRPWVQTILLYNEYQVISGFRTARAWR
jgi:hypothetical protein